ncbi:MAG: polysaccharide biosynthesis protein [Gemmatimonadales bacterium]
MRFLLRNRSLFVVDVVGWALIPLAALAIRLDGFDGLEPYLARLAVFTGWAIFCNSAMMYRGGMYRRMWRYASLDEMFGITSSLLLAGVAVSLIHFAIAPWLVAEYPFVAVGVPRLPRSLPIISTLFAIAWSGGFRFALRFGVAERLRHKGRGQARRALIIGAGDAGSSMARELLANRDLDLEPVGFIDDDPEKAGREIFRLPILGDRTDIARVAETHHASVAILAMPAVSGTVVREMQALCREAGLETKIIPGFDAILTGKVTHNQLRPVQIEDLLRRDAVQTDHQAVADLVNGMTVLVTGAGGSIGSELCRQISVFGAREVILLGHGENSIFDIHNELRARHPEVRFTPIIADVRDARRIDLIFSIHKPQAVFHAAAHKHVPLMEANCDEAVTNNIGGTHNVVQAAARHGTQHFVMISTDKAVNPANIMGATKLVAEKLVHEAALKTGRPYVSVRFGNVLGSRGSVVPIFKAQIAAGGPVRVTHPEMTRYFMTIPEAVQLVIRAGDIGAGKGEVFVLDMGEPVKIVDLAHNMIRLAGYEPGAGIAVEFTQPRPGEKLHEELVGDAEDLQPTAAKRIHRAVRLAPLDPEWVETTLNSLEHLVMAGDEANLAERVVALISDGVSAPDPGAMEHRPPAR